MAEFDIAGTLNSLYRRRGLIVAVFLVVSTLSAYLAIILPPIYRSSTLILVTPQRIPASFVTSTVTMDLPQRMQSIIQEILSRTKLAEIIKEFNLHPGGSAVGLESRIESLRKSIVVQTRSNNVFQLSFESQDPMIAQQVVSRLATFFIDQNLLAREQETVGTKSFINAEAARLRKELEEQEVLVNTYRTAHRYELPDQVDTNLRSIEQLRRELEADNSRLSSLQARKSSLEKELVTADISRLATSDTPSNTEQQGIRTDLQLAARKKELASYLSRYSAKHPDVIRLTREIVELESGLSGFGVAKNQGSADISSGNPLKDVLRTQIAAIESEMESLRSQIERTRNQIGVLQTRIDSSPLRNIELAKVSRNYDITLRKFQDLLAKGLESEISENMEKKQKAEQFQIADPANFPLSPVRPNRLYILGVGLALGLGGGLGLAFLWDNLDRSFKSADDIHASINVPLLATLPALITRGSIVEQRQAQGILVLSSIGALGVGLILVRLLGPLYF